MTRLDGQQVRGERKTRSLETQKAVRFQHNPHDATLTVIENLVLFLLFIYVILSSVEC